MGLLECIEEIEDIRSARGIRHPASAIVKATILSLLAGYTKIEQMSHYIASVWEEVNEPLGFRHWHPPDPGTYRNVLRLIPVASLSKAFETWVSELLSEEIFDVSVDGKACRGLQVGKNPQNVFMMLNVFAQDVQLTLAQWRLEEKQGEPTVLAKHLELLVERYPGIRLFTGDAYFSGRTLCQAITDLNRHYLVRIKGNQGEVEEALQTWFKEVMNKKQTATITSRPEKRGA